MSYAGMKMQSLFMMMPAHIFNRDARVFLQGWGCKFLVVQVPSNGHVMKQMLFVGMSWCKCPIGACYDANARLGMQWMQMSHWEYAMMRMSLWCMLWCECPLVGMSWCKCSCRYAMNANVLMVHAMMRMFPWCMPWCECSLGSTPWCECLLGSMPWRECPLVGMQWMPMPVWVCNECKCPLAGMPWHGMLWCKHNLFKNSFYFQNEASTTPETKIFSNSIYYS